MLLQVTGDATDIHALLSSTGVNSWGLIPSTQSNPDEPMTVVYVVLSFIDVCRKYLYLNSFHYHVIVHKEK